MKTINGVIVLALSFFMTSCNFSSTSEESDSSISTNEVTSIALKRVGEHQKPNVIFTNSVSTKFELYATYENGEETLVNGSNVSWSVSDRSILSVDSVGSVSGKANGEAYVKAKYHNLDAQYDLKVVTVAKTFNKKDYESEYRKDEIYSFPLEISPLDASLDIKISDESIIQPTSVNNNFKVLAVGTCNVSITAYIDILGNTKTYDFTFETMSANAPIFYFNYQKSNKGTYYVAKNKYSSLDFNTFGIVAKTKDGVDISSQIKIDSGEYDLTKEGKYVLNLSCTDNNYKVTSYFTFTLFVEEYEVKYETSPFDAIETNNLQYEFIKSASYVTSVTAIDFSIDYQTNDRYVELEGKLHFYVNFSIKSANGLTNYSYVEKEYYQEFEIGEDFTNNGTLTIHFEPTSTMNEDTFSLVGGSVYLIGKAYYHQYY